MEAQDAEQLLRGVAPQPALLRRQVALHHRPLAHESASKRASKILRLAVAPERVARSFWPAGKQGLSPRLPLPKTSLEMPAVVAAQRAAMLQACASGVQLLFEMPGVVRLLTRCRSRAPVVELPPTAQAPRAMISPPLPLLVRGGAPSAWGHAPGRLPMIPVASVLRMFLELER